MKIQILSIPRSGSSYFRSMLNAQMKQFEDYYTISEPFNLSKAHLCSHNNKTQVMQQLNHSTHALVKIQPYELLTKCYEQFIDNYVNIPWYTICLLRKDIFEASLSRLIAIQTGIWDDVHVSTAFCVEFEELKKYINDTLYWTDIILDNKFNFNYGKIVFYEDLYFNSACDLLYLELPIEHVSYYETSKKYLKEYMIVNYYELKEKSQHYLEDLAWNRL